MMIIIRFFSLQTTSELLPPGITIHMDVLDKLNEAGIDPTLITVYADELDLSGAQVETGDELQKAIIELHKDVDAQQDRALKFLQHNGCRLSRKMPKVLLFCCFVFFW